MLITVITPTYNRAEYIIKAYNSLLRQTMKDFLWIVVDDGSTDNTKEIIDALILENKIAINYFYKENGGQHTAINLGVDKCETKYLIELDSDDCLADDALETILRYWDKYGDDSKISTLYFLAAYEDGEIVGNNWFPSDEYRSCFKEMYKRKKGDIRASHKTEIFKQYRSPEFPGENRVNGAREILMGWDYDYVYINKVVYIYYYLDSGVSNNLWSYIRRSPKGTLYILRLYLDPRFKFLDRVKSMFTYLAVCFLLNEKNVIRNSEYPLLASIVFVPARMLHFYRTVIKKRLPQDGKKIKDGKVV